MATRNWLRDYSQAMDTGALKKAQPETIRILVWLLSFLGFGYATAEFEVTSERLGVYRPEEHIEYGVFYQFHLNQKLTKLRIAIQRITMTMRMPASTTPASEDQFATSSYKSTWRPG
jgi:hypothetical protein